MRSLIRRDREWMLSPSPDESITQEIKSALSCNTPFAVLLARRGGNDWQRLVDPDAHDFHSPWLLTGMEAAVSRIMEGIKREERIFIHGDFDVDGLTGAAVLYLGLLPLLPRGKIKVEVGDRTRGHGLSKGFVRRAIEEDFPLVITADCGISNAAETASLHTAGVDTVITDHHLSPPVLPKAAAIINPQQPGDTYPNKDLAGVGVAYKLISGLYERLGRPTPLQLLDLVALGTIADLVPLSNQGEVENRAMVREGFSVLANGEGAPGLRVLMKKMSVNPARIDTFDVSYFIAPKLNAANRAGDPKVAFLLLTTGKLPRAEYLTEVLLDYNKDREIAQNDLLAQAERAIADGEIDPVQDGITIVAGKHWNRGIIGLTASNLVDRYQVPAIVISKGGKLSRASCRSVEGFDIVACLKDNSDLFTRYGGHPMAAGFSIPTSALPLLYQRIRRYAAAHRTELAERVERIDTNVNLSEIDQRLYTNLCSLSPYGPGNQSPRFLSRGCSFTALSLVGSRRQHLKGKVSQDGTSLPFIAFNMGRYINTFEREKGACLVFRTGFDTWQGTVQAEGIDLVTD
ncbi:MAG: single-stranded-DNA-specific exonuclease RecJ [Candidatus Bipolaricaulota bacterium]|nr:single-stranded-DNA-specific exonuclease RecJ [Candidatus Bipolaricaulota bacterium]